MFAARAVDPQRQAKGGTHSGLTIFHCAMTVPNSLLKVLPESQFGHLLGVVFGVLEVDQTLRGSEVESFARLVKGTI